MASNIKPIIKEDVNRLISQIDHMLNKKDELITGQYQSEYVYIGWLEASLRQLQKQLKGEIPII